MKRSYHPTPAALAARETVARSLAQDLLAAERNIEKSLSGAARMLEVVMARRSELEVSVHIGQRMIEEGIELISALAAARSRAAQLHDTMVATQRQLGVELVMPNSGEKSHRHGEALQFMQRVEQPALALVK